MSTAKILTLHPDPAKQGVNIDRAKYDQMRAAIRTALAEQDRLTFSELRELLEHQLRTTFSGSIGWYLTTVKLDLQARGEVVASGSPQMLRLS